MKRQQGTNSFQYSPEEEEIGAQQSQRTQLQSRTERERAAQQQQERWQRYQQQEQQQQQQQQPQRHQYVVPSPHNLLQLQGLGYQEQLSDRSQQMLFSPQQHQLDPSSYLHHYSSPQMRHQWVSNPQEEASYAQQFWDSPQQAWDNPQQTWSSPQQTWSSSQQAWNNPQQTTLDNSQQYSFTEYISPLETSFSPQQTDISPSQQAWGIQHQSLSNYFPSEQHFSPSQQYDFLQPQCEQHQRGTVSQQESDTTQQQRRISSQRQQQRVSTHDCSEQRRVLCSQRHDCSEQHGVAVPQQISSPPQQYISPSQQNVSPQEYNPLQQLQQQQYDLSKQKWDFQTQLSVQITEQQRECESPEKQQRVSTQQERGGGEQQQSLQRFSLPPPQQQQQRPLQRQPKQTGPSQQHSQQRDSPRRQQNRGQSQQQQQQQQSQQRDFPQWQHRTQQLQHQQQKQSQFQQHQQQQKGQQQQQKKVHLQQQLQQRDSSHQWQQPQQRDSNQQQQKKGQLLSKQQRNTTEEQQQTKDTSSQQQQQQQQHSRSQQRQPQLGSSKQQQEQRDSFHQWQRPPQGISNQQQQKKGQLLSKQQKDATEQQQQRKNASFQQQQQPSRSQQQQSGSSSKQQQQQSRYPDGDWSKQIVSVQQGIKGRKIPIETNHLLLNLGNLKRAAFYSVHITPANKPKYIYREIMNQLRHEKYSNCYPAFDGKGILYYIEKLPFGDSLTQSITYEDENGHKKEFTVELNFTKYVDLSLLHDMLLPTQLVQDAIQCVDIVLRNTPSMNCITAASSFFTPSTNEQIISLSGGMELYHGFYQSAVRGWKPFLNLDVSHKMFPKAMKLIDAVIEVCSDSQNTLTKDSLKQASLNPHQTNIFQEFIKKMKITYEIQGQSGSKRIYRVNGLDQSACTARFRLGNDGLEQTVAEYYKTCKHKILEYSHLPTVWVGSPQNRILVPMEFCRIEKGHVVNTRPNDNQKRRMINHTATNTTKRKLAIKKCLSTVNYNADPCVREFGFSVSNNFECLEARVLTPPILKYANNQSATPRQGTWRIEGKKFLTGSVIKKWSILNTCSSSVSASKVNVFAQEVSRIASRLGIKMSSRPHQTCITIQCQNNIERYFETKTDFDLIFVVLADNSNPLYSYVKKAAELNIGCLTQCIKAKNVSNNKMMTALIENILLKVNSKMNGTNHCLFTRPAIMNKPCMIMGADVTHPSPGSVNIPSVAAVTASHDPKAFLYNICWRLQPSRTEIINDLYEITRQQLMYFYRSNKGQKPYSIIFFRDGVSDGQFDQVLQTEIQAMRSACSSLGNGDYQPKITFLVVQKRHHTRLFPMRSQDSEDRNFNVPAGTCVDTVITNPAMQNFYLVSHASIQGVAKPTKYLTLWDDNDMSNDDIEELTYHLCHMFTRCNRSVSYPAPTYYAHLAAARAKVYIEDETLNMNDLTAMQNRFQIQDCISRDKPMFFV